MTMGDKMYKEMFSKLLDRETEIEAALADLQFKIMRTSNRRFDLGHGIAAREWTMAEIEINKAIKASGVEMKALAARRLLLDAKIEPVGTDPREQIRRGALIESGVNPDSATQKSMERAAEFADTLDKTYPLG